jgi:hypothetical protein
MVNGNVLKTPLALSVSKPALSPSKPALSLSKGGAAGEACFSGPEVENNSPQFMVCSDPLHGIEG